MNRFFILFLALCGLSVKAVRAEATMDFTYAVGTGGSYYWSTLKIDDYDIAIRLNDPNFIGKKIVSVTVPLHYPEAQTDYSIWLSRELTLQTDPDTRKKVNVPDVAAVAVEPEGRNIQVTFDEPYTIPEGGIYVGYSFKVPVFTEETRTQNPVVVQKMVNPDGFYVHTSRTFQKWSSLSETIGVVSSMVVTMEGDFKKNAVCLVSLDEGKAKVDEKGSVRAVIDNHGLQEVTSIDYSYQVGSVKAGGHVDLASPMKPIYGKKVEVDLPIKALKEIGLHDLTLSITRVNGVVNAENTPVATSYRVFAAEPKHRPLLEEYTGLWCGYCPLGFVGLELMHELYPDDFVAISYHTMDIMQAFNDEDLPNTVSGYPSSWMDRSRETDPYCGTLGRYHFGIDKLWEEHAARFAEADIDVEAHWNSDDPRMIDVSTTLVFADNMENLDYRLAYVLVADDLYGGDTDINWVQQNYYSGDTNWSGLPGMDTFVEGRALVAGLHFNDVAVAHSGAKGIEGSVPSAVSFGEPYAHSYRFDSSDAVCNYGKSAGTPLIQNPEKLRVVAILIDNSTGEVVNCNKAAVTGAEVTGITGLDKGTGIVRSVEYYDSMGRCIKEPAQGMSIKKVTYTDGKVQTVKMVK